MTFHSTRLDGFSSQAHTPVTSAQVTAVVPAQPVDYMDESKMYRRVVKRALDITLVMLALPLVLPLVVLMALAIFLQDGGNPFYLQSRVGRNGRAFRMWKLRTMVTDADTRLQAYLQANPDARAEWTKDQKLKRDPRITGLGRILRKCSLDELPQLLNVLLGDMALVGPRPMMLDQQDMYHGKAYFRLRPGVTGFWQISDRNECRFQDRVRFDEAYDRSLSLITDVAVLFRTVAVIVRGTGY
ncbi:sugar transferase [Gymnodinialimonas sp. 2305UL16-5]|uniref:sugar transferase n=1 Tax=Gymnodinialimonas mytili TaxID=3126503 RepID=UPI0030B6C178